MKRVSIDARMAAILSLIGIAQNTLQRPKPDGVALLAEHARQAIDALQWLRDDPEAQALMKAQAARKSA